MMNNPELMRTVMQAHPGIREVRIVSDLLCVAQDAGRKDWCLVCFSFGISC